MKIYMLIGISGSGKTTFGQKMFEDAAKERLKAYIFSSDAIRKELYGDETIQKNPKEVFDLMYKRMHEAIDSGAEYIVYDATNLKQTDRAVFLQEFYGNDIIAVVRQTSLEIALSRNATRERHVPEAVIRKQYKQFQQNPISKDEGFFSIRVYKDM